MGTQVEHPGQHLSINNLPVRATLSCTALKLHEGSLRDLMSWPSWILVELIRAMPKGQKKRPSSHQVLATCLYVWIPHQDKEQRKNTQSKFGRLGERHRQGCIF